MSRSCKLLQITYLIFNGISVYSTSNQIIPSETHTFLAQWLTITDAKQVIAVNHAYHSLLSETSNKFHTRLLIMSGIKHYLNLVPRILDSKLERGIEINILCFSLAQTLHHFEEMIDRMEPIDWISTDEVENIKRRSTRNITNKLNELREKNNKSKNSRCINRMLAPGIELACMFLIRL